MDTTVLVVAATSFAGALAGALVHGLYGRKTERDRLRHEIARTTHQKREEIHMELVRKCGLAHRALLKFGKQLTKDELLDAKSYLNDARNCYSDCRPYLSHQVKLKFEKLEDYMARWIGNTEARLAGHRTAPYAREGLQKRVDALSDQTGKDLMLDLLGASVRRSTISKP